MIESQIYNDYYGKFSLITLDETSVEGQKFKLEIEINQVTNGKTLLIGKKTFSWPDKNYPNHIEYDDESFVLTLRSSTNIAEVSLRFPANSLNIGKSAKEPVKVLKGFTTTPKKLQTSNPFFAKVKAFTNKNSDANWKALVGSVPAFLKSPCDMVERLEQEGEKVLINHLIAKKDATEVFNAVMVGKCLSLESAEYLTDKIIEISAFELLEFLILQSGMSFNDITFAKMIKAIVNHGQTEVSRALFEKLLLKGFGSSNLGAILEKTLTVEEVLKIMKWFIDAPICNENGLYYQKMMQLSCVLLDSHFQKFLWTPDTHDFIRRFYNWTQAWGFMAETFTSLKESAAIYKALSSEMGEILTSSAGYSIKKVELSRVPLAF
uniref:ERAP1_C domain-containing protein n=1 Tax=Rhabditophanes sp. KR3021 TaxID=114890 RepID=A0AC35UEL2_9BILA